MKYIRKTSYNIKENFLENLLIDRKILPEIENEREAFYSPTIQNELSPNLLDNIEEGYQMLMKHLKKGSKIYLVIDPDQDGITSSSLFYNYLRDNYNNYNYSIDYHIPEGKEHGLQTLMPLLTENKIADLIVCPDSSSNDYEEHRFLKEMGYDILILDHHITEKYSENAVVINNQPSKQYSNKMLSGVGVVYKFFEYCEQKEERQSTIKNYLDIVALGLIGDMMEMSTLENRYICDYGLSHINNKFFKAILEKQSYSLGDGPLTQIGVAFYVTPLINALIRIGSQIEKERLFQAFINPDLEVPSTKRGEKGQFETVCEQAVRNCVNAKSRQNRLKDKALELLDIQIMENCLDENKILILNADDLDVPNTITGLCAMGVAAKYKKPTILGRISPDNILKGSLRGRDDSELTDFRGFLKDSGLVEYADGHSQAAGCGIKVSNIDKLISYSNEKLANINFNEGFYEVDFIVKGNFSKLSELIEDLDRGKKFFGQGCKEPLIAIEDIALPPSSYSIIGKAFDTLRFEFNGITYIKFKATDLIEELKQKNGSLIITVIGRGNVNTWGGNSKPQILIDEIDFKESSIYDF